MTLRGLREGVGLKQTDVADSSGIDQGDVSRLEARDSFDDCLVATLRRYVAALGGRLELVAAFGDRRVTVVPPTTAEADAAQHGAEDGRRVPPT
jgi:predicted transcriptional regulator